MSIATPGAAVPSRPRPAGRLDTSGLTSAEAAERLATYGRNVYPTTPPTPLWRRVVEQLRDPMIVVLLVAAVLTIATKDTADAAIIALVVVINTAVGVAQQLRADRAVAALSALSAPAARVLRDGTVTVVPAGDVVPGDVVILGEGDIVPADGTLVEAAALLVDESALTGESMPVEKLHRHGEHTGDPVSAGTVVVRGRGVAVVTATGRASALGRIAAALDTAPARTPLQRRLTGLSRVLSVVAGGLCVVVATIGLVRGQPFELMAVTAISLVVAAVPESLPAVVTLALALGARRMAARHAIVRRLPAVETLGSVTIIATDKTGTLTEGRMVVEWLWTPHGDAAVSGTGYAPVGAITDDHGEITPEHAPHLFALLDAVVLCNDAAVTAPEDGSGEWEGVGDPTEAALLAAAAKAGVTRSSAEAARPRLDELPFDSDRRRMTTVHRDPDGGVLLVCKGAPDALLRPDVLDVPAGDLEGARARAAAFAHEGFRVLAVASRRRPMPPADLAAEEQHLDLLGLVAIADPPRVAAVTTVASCRDAGIRPVLITGDLEQTARAIAQRVGILEDGEEGDVVTGPQLRAGAGVDTTGTAVFARMAPDQKLDVVDAWRRAGHVVAMTGDGVNDGPALRRADIGVAMGRRGTEVARQAADMVLADDDLATLVAAVEEGRRIYANVRRFLVYGLAGGAAEILLMLLGPAFGLALPLLPAQILWVNLMTHGLPGVAFGAEPAEPGLMTQPPRPPSERVLGDGLWQRAATLALVVTAVSLGTGVWAHAGGRPWQSMVFLALGCAQLAIALGLRVRDAGPHPFLPLAVATAFGLQVAALYLTPLQDLLSTEPLTVAEFGAVAALSAVGYVAARIVGTQRRHSAGQPGPERPGTR